jgi:hypothetical protein
LYGRRLIHPCKTWDQVVQVAAYQEVPLAKVAEVVDRTHVLASVLRAWEHLEDRQARAGVIELARGFDPRRWLELLLNYAVSAAPDLPTFLRFAAVAAPPNR